MLRVKDFTWHPGYMELNEAVLDEPMRAEVKLRRGKRHYHERAYGYEMPGGIASVFYPSRDHGC